MGLATGLAIGGSLLGAGLQSRQAGRATRAQEQAAQAGIEEQRRQFDLAREDFAPFRQTGTQAVNRLGQLVGGDMEAFQESPDYQFRLAEGTRALDRSAASRGRLFSGGYGRDLTEFGQGLASTEFGNYFNRLMGLSQLGAGIAGQQAQLGQQTASNIGNLYGNIGQAQSQGALARGSIYGNLFNQMGQLGGWRAGG